jgi:subtilisin family serine protease
LIRTGTRTILAALAAAPLVLLVGSARGATRNPPPGEIRLQAGSFDPLREPPGAVLGRFPEPLRSLAAPDGLVLLQFRGVPLAPWLETLRASGTVVFDYVPENAYLARVPPERLAEVRGREFVRAVVPYLPALRVAPDLARPDGTRPDGPIRLLLQAAPDRDPDALAEAAGRAAPGRAARGQGRHPGAALAEITVETRDLARLLPRLASIPDLLWIEERRPIVTHNSEMKWVLQTAIPTVTRLFSKGLTGDRQILAEADTGLDIAHCFFHDPDQSVTFELINPDNPPATPLTNPAHRKVLAYQYHSGSNTIDQVDHGTHVAGTAVGDDLAHRASGSDPGLDPYDGMAPAARMVFQDVDTGGQFLEIPANLYGFVQAAYNAGARFHTNSWGAATTSYTSDSSQVDRFSWDNPGMLFLFSAGNDGPNSGTIHAPATAKNVIAVGMTQTPAAGDPNNLDSASSNGPTSDGRRKPEVANVGGFPIQSADGGTACGLVGFGGTSMATPGVAGGAALVRQYLADGFYPHGYPGSGPARDPSAALIKAIVANSAVNMSGTNVDAPIPDNSQGWGRVLLDNALFFPNDAVRMLILRDDDLGSRSDGFPMGAATADSFQVYNCRTDLPLKVTLVWTEPPVAATSGQAWVNNLNLEVVTPGGTLYRGSVFSGGVSTTGGTADDRNNVEQVLLPAGAVASGVYTVRVVPASVAVGPQPYALIVTGDVSEAPRPLLEVSAVTRGPGCDGDPFLDDNETLEIAYTIANRGCGAAGPFDALLSADPALPFVIHPAGVPVGGLAAGDAATVAFKLNAGDTGGACGGDLPLLLTLQAADGARWELPHTQLLRLDPATGSRSHSDDVESGDLSVAKAAAWAIRSCRVSSGASSWHMGDADCSGIPRDAGAHSLEFSVALAAGENLTTASFTHAFDGFSNASFADSIHFEIDHDLDGTYSRIASWLDNAAPLSMSPAGPYDLSAFNQGRAASVRFRFRFQSAAQWVGPNSAPGWDVDDFRVNIEIFGTCDEPSTAPPPGNVGDTLLVSASGADLVLSWTAVPDAAAYRVRRAEVPDLAGADSFTTFLPSFTDPGVALDPRPVLYYRAFAVNACGVSSAD